jgi:hypothetical protein
LNPITVNHLTTKYDYADFKVAAAKAGFKKSEKLILRILGTLLILAALILNRFFHGTVYQNIIYIAMVALGGIIGCFYEIIAHYAARQRALNYFESNKEKFIAQLTVFHEKQISFKTDRYTAAIPYDLLYKVYEDGRVFIIYTGIGEMRFIPKRAVSESECMQIRNILQSKLQEKYQQEGVH